MVANNQINKLKGFLQEMVANGNNEKPEINLYFVDFKFKNSKIFFKKWQAIVIISSH